MNDKSKNVKKYNLKLSHVTCILLVILTLFNIKFLFSLKDFKDETTSLLGTVVIMDQIIIQGNKDLLFKDYEIILRLNRLRN